MLLQLGGIWVQLARQSGLATRLGGGQFSLHVSRFHLGDHHIEADTGQGWPTFHVVEHIFNPICPEAHPNTTDALPTENTGQVGVPAAPTNAAHGSVFHNHLENGPGVIVQPARKQWVYMQVRLWDAGQGGPTHQIFQFTQGFSRTRPFAEQLCHLVQRRLGVRSLANAQKFLNHGQGRIWNAARLEFLGHPFQPHLVELVHGHRPVCERGCGHAAGF